MIPTIIVGIRYKSIFSAGGSSKPTGDDGALHKATVVPAMVKNNVIKIVL